MTFRALNWSPNEMVSETKMDILGENAEWLFANTPRSIYTLPGGLRRVEGIKIASGRAIITKRSRGSATVEVRFGNFFSSRCEPNITTGVISNSHTRIFEVVNGIGRLLPDARGFQLEVSLATTEKKKSKINRSFYVSWSAMGY